MSVRKETGNIMPVIAHDWRCPTCGHMVDTPQHELGCPGLPDKAPYVKCPDCPKDRQRRYAKEKRSIS